MSGEDFNNAVGHQLHALRVARKSVKREVYIAKPIHMITVDGPI